MRHLDLPLLHAELTQFYYPGDLDFPLPPPCLLVTLNPVTVWFDLLTLVWLNSFTMNLQRSVARALVRDMRICPWEQIVVHVEKFVAVDLELLCPPASMLLALPSSRRLMLGGAGVECKPLLAATYDRRQVQGEVPDSYDRVKVPALIAQRARCVSSAEIGAGLHQDEDGAEGHRNDRCDPACAT